MVQVASHWMTILNLAKIISQKKTYIIVRLVSVVQRKRGMEFGKRSGTETMGNMTLWSAGDKNEEGEAVMVKETRDKLKDVALRGRIVAFIKTINDNQTSRSWCIEISLPNQVMKRLDNEGRNLGFHGSSEDERVPLNGSNNLLSCPRDVDRDLVGNCGDKGFGVIACGIRTREEETSEKEIF